MSHRANFDQSCPEVSFRVHSRDLNREHENSLELNSTFDENSVDSSDATSPRTRMGRDVECSPLMKSGPNENPGISALELNSLSETQAIESPREQALTGKPAENINYLHYRHVGLFLQYFCLGICYSFTIGINYEFFTSYLGQTGNFFNVARAAISLPWTFKFLYGCLNDCLPIKGYRRKPYMMIGWAGCAVIALVLALYPLPDSRFVRNEEEIAKGHCDTEPVLKDSSYDDYYTAQSMRYMSLLFLFNVFLVLTDVAMDGLMVQYARKEPMKTRGRAQTFIYATRQIGMICGALVKGFGLNWYDYSGPWCKGFEITHIFIITCVISCIAIPIVLFMTTEEKTDDQKSVSYVCSRTWALLQSSAVQQVLVFEMGAGALNSVASPADSMIQRYWVGVDNLTKNVLIGVVGGFMFSVGTIIFAKFLINMNWAKIYGTTSIIVTSMNASLTYIVIFDVIRNQYMYLSDELTQEFFVGVNYICALLLFIELSEADTEGMSYALMTTAVNAAQSVGGIMGNFLVAPFEASDPERFLRDSTSDRRVIAIQYAIIYSCNLAVLFLLPLLPQGKAQTQELRKRSRNRKAVGIVLICIICLFVLLSLTYSFVLYRLFPS